jgi:hypothetical protein
VAALLPEALARDIVEKPVPKALGGGALAVDVDDQRAIALRRSV